MKPDGVYPGGRCAVEHWGVLATGTLVAGIGRGRYVVRLDGTDQSVTVDGDMIRPAAEDEAATT